MIRYNTRFDADDWKLKSETEISILAQRVGKIQRREEKYVVKRSIYDRLKNRERAITTKELKFSIASNS